MITGSIVALVTPMTPEGAVDREALDRLIEMHVVDGTNAIVAAGTTGEASTLNYEEHCAVIRQVVERVAGRIPVIAGTGANSTTEAIALTRAAKAAGADACLLVTPYYNRPTQEGLYLHHKAIAEAVEIDQILYNVPGRTGCDMLPDTVQRLAELPNIVAIKEATGDLERARELIERLPADFAVYSGDDGTAVELMLLGGQGNISVTANIAPAEMAEICALALAGEADQARNLNRSLAGMHETLFIEANPIPVKWALARMHLMDTGIRLPLTPLSADAQPVLEKALRAADLI